MEWQACEEPGLRSARIAFGVTPGFFLIGLAPATGDISRVAKYYRRAGRVS